MASPALKTPSSCKSPRLIDAAYEKSIAHRDLKPANIKVGDDGQVKVLDVGLAKAMADEVAAHASISPTMTAMASRLRVIVGTAAYQSPEPAKGIAVDKRTESTTSRGRQRDSRRAGASTPDPAVTRA